MQGTTQTEGGVPASGSVLWRHVMATTARSKDRHGASGGETPARADVVRSPERAVAGAIGRAADRVHRLPLFFDRIEWSQAVLAELGELLPDGALVSLIEGPGDSLGVVAICPDLLAAITEMQTAGRVSSRPAPRRRPTRTDGSICTDFINAALAELGAEPVSHSSRDRIRGYRYASHVDDLRTLNLLLEDGPFHHLSVRLRAGEAGQRNGELILLWPSDTATTGDAGPDDPDPTGSDGATTRSLAETVRSAPIELLGVLCRRRISLRELAALSPGDVIALPPDALGAATLETAIGQVLFRGKLGEMAGRHALRLLAAADVPAPAAGAGDPLAGLPRRDDSFPLGDLDAPDPFRQPRSVAPLAEAVASPGPETPAKSA